jgi:hypothetical protein
MMKTPTSQRCRKSIVNVSPKPVVSKSHISAFELTIEQEDALNIRTEHVKSNLLSGKNFFVSKTNKNYNRIVKLIKEQEGNILRELEKEINFYYIGTEADKDFGNVYHSDVIFALLANEAGLDRYLLQYYSPAPPFNKWNESVLEELSISVNYLPLSDGDVWLNSHYNEQDVANFVSKLVSSYNDLCLTTSYTTSSESQNRRFIHLLFDHLVLKWNTENTNSMRQFYEKYIRNLDSRYGFGKIDLIIGSEKKNSISLDVVYIVVEAKYKINDNNYAQVVGELIACFVGNSTVSKEQREIYAILTDGVNLQFFMLSEFKEKIIIDRSDAICLGYFTGYQPQTFEPSNQLPIVARILLSLFNSDFNCRPFQRRLDLLSQLEEQKNDNKLLSIQLEESRRNFKEVESNLLSQLEEQKNDNKLLSSQLEEVRRNFEQLEKKMEEMKQEYFAEIEHLKNEQRIYNKETSKKRKFPICEEERNIRQKDVK